MTINALPTITQEHNGKTIRCQTTDTLTLDPSITAPFEVTLQVTTNGQITITTVDQFDQGWAQFELTTGTLPGYRLIAHPTAALRSDLKISGSNSMCKLVYKESTEIGPVFAVIPLAVRDISIMNPDFSLNDKFPISSFAFTDVSSNSNVIVKTAHGVTAERVSNVEITHSHGSTLTDTRDATIYRSSGATFNVANTALVLDSPGSQLIKTSKFVVAASGGVTFDGSQLTINGETGGSSGNSNILSLNSNGSISVTGANRSISIVGFTGSVNVAESRNVSILGNDGSVTLSRAWTSTVLGNRGSVNILGNWKGTNPGDAFVESEIVFAANNSGTTTVENSNNVGSLNNKGSTTAVSSEMITFVGNSGSVSTTRAKKVTAIGNSAYTTISANETNTNMSDITVIGSKGSVNVVDAYNVTVLGSTGSVDIHSTVGSGNGTSKNVCVINSGGEIIGDSDFVTVMNSPWTRIENSNRVLSIQNTGTHVGLTESLIFGVALSTTNCSKIVSFNSHGQVSGSDRGMSLVSSLNLVIDGSDSIHATSSHYVNLTDTWNSYLHSIEYSTISSSGNLVLYGGLDTESTGVNNVVNFVDMTTSGAGLVQRNNSELIFPSSGALDARPDPTYLAEDWPPLAPMSNFPVGDARQLGMTYASKVSVSGRVYDTDGTNPDTFIDFTTDGKILVTIGSPDENRVNVLGGRDGAAAITGSLQFYDPISGAYQKVNVDGIVTNAGASMNFTVMHSIGLVSGLTWSHVYDPAKRSFAFRCNNVGTMIYAMGSGQLDIMNLVTNR